MKKQFLALALLGFVSLYATMKFDVVVTDGQEVEVGIVAVNPEQESVVELGAYKLCVCMKEAEDRSVTIHCNCHDKETSFNPAEQNSATLSVETENGNTVIVTIMPHDEVAEQTAE